MGKPATVRSAGVVGSTEPDDRGTESGPRAGSRKIPRSAATDDSSRCRPTHRAGFCADHRESRAISVWETDCELSRTGATGKVQRKSETLGHITKQGSSMVRFLLVEAAQVTVRSLPEWRRKYVQLMMRRGRKIAKVAMARRLAVALYWMWRKGWNYEQSKSSVRTRASSEQAMVCSRTPSN